VVENVVEGRLGLADFLADLRAELDDARQRARGASLALRVDQVEVSLDVACTLVKSGETGAQLKARFWVFASAEAGAKGSVSASRVNTQHLKLTLTPRLEQSVVDGHGAMQTVAGAVDVRGTIGPDEESPEILSEPTNNRAG
jgi:Trypsin-co-occurring domain 2